MNKKLIVLATLTLGLAIGTLSTAPVFAETAADGARVMSEPADDATAGEVMPISEEPTALEEEGTSGEAEVVEAEVIDADTAEEGATDDAEIIETEEAEEEEAEPMMWPMYVSLGALGFMVLMIIILNAGSKRK